MLQGIIGYQYDGVILIILDKWHTTTQNLPDKPHLGCSDISQHSSSVDSAIWRKMMHQVAWLINQIHWQVLLVIRQSVEQRK